MRAIWWENILHLNNDVNAMFDIFLDEITQIIDKHIPIKKFNSKEIKSISKPWIIPGIETSIKV